MASVCKFYLNGNCRYGNKCWNLHPDPGSGRKYNQRGDYFVSTDHKSLVRIDPQQGASPNVQFSFNHALENRAGSSNRFATLAEYDMEDIEDHEAHQLSRDKKQFSFKLDNRREGQLFGKETFQSHAASPQPFSFNLSHLSGKVADKYEGLFRPQSSPASKPFSPTQNTGTGVFGKTTAFGNAMTYQSQFNVQEPRTPYKEGLFGASTVNTQSVFGTTIISKPSARESQPLFGIQLNSIAESSNYNVPKGLFGKPQILTTEKVKDVTDDRLRSVLKESAWLEKNVCHVYSDKENLSDMDKNSYMANTFKLHEIPIKPPPKELCV